MNLDHVDETAVTVGAVSNVNATEVSNVIQERIVQPMQQLLEPSMPSFDAISSFTGIGGLDLGVQHACQSSGAKFNTLLAIDNWNAPELNYPLNFEGDFLLKDILTISGAEILERVSRKRGELHCVWGGPPCPGWSRANRKRNDGNASLLETNLLTFKFIDLVKELAPLSFFMEQVDGMGDIELINGFHELLCRFKEDLKDYEIRAKEIRTLYLGVPQDRTRWIFVGWRRDTGMIPVFPKPIKGSLQHLTIGAVAPEIDYVEVRGSRILRKENTEFFSTIPATESMTLHLREGIVQKLSERPDLLMKIFGYPEDFQIHPDLSFAQIHRLIGNSVPPPLAKAVFAEIIKQLRSL